MSAEPAPRPAPEPRNPWIDQLRLMRPRQWPILTAQLAVGVLCSPAMRATLAGEGSLAWSPLAAAWFAWVVALNGGTLAYNSAYDRDTEDIAYLSSPPPPPADTARNTLLLMIAGVGVGWLASPVFAVVTAVCVVLSVVYSHPAVRLKGIPGADMAVNVVGYGAGTTLAGLAAGAHAAGASSWPDTGGWWLAAGFGLLFGSFYPMTQLYQLEADRERGDLTLALALGVRGSLTLAVGLGAAATACLVMAFAAWDLPTVVPGAAGTAWTVFCLVWLGRGAAWTPRTHERMMYRGLAVWAAVDTALVLGALLGPG